ncbi:MAG TPA: tRNA (adenosine(37)-N6)-threonylcarbamoyltransferase complex ATPase subunit type 1 TsaE [Candidatus Krumholzibacterium sp.]|nr:tRNA (adenosine(37)-N6)-threonylcarbamoyltransferase complex ATPase subunit type 1 TsaE [Candidatus Krumholzibacterium sp.]
MAGRKKEVEGIRLVSGSPEETARIGARLAAAAGRGAVISLEGGLGAGKTCLVKGMAAGLGIDAEVLSPTFILVEEYRGDVTLLHYDLYRLEEMEEVESLGFFDAIDGENMLVVEWGDRLPDPDRIFDVRVRITITGEGQREIDIHGDAELLERMR